MCGYEDIVHIYADNLTSFKFIKDVNYHKNLHTSSPVKKHNVK
jgi:hypothetical protein